MDTKAAFDREAFEAWFEREGHEELCGSSNVGAMIKHIAKSSWTASRAAIEIDLPYNDVISDETDEQWDKAVDACSKAITSHGIRIKGKTE
ncbi:hypothetical protein [Rahnella bonaserana]|uniref:hypothetical protein n=1 Tax=Rahnella bonaserana TaxID=2816248 RepID=UPI00320906D2